MSFLEPLYLLLAGAAAVPLLLHLMRRRIGTRVPFPAVRYLVRAEQEHSRKLRLRNLLLMLLRVAALLAIAAAAARPVARLFGSGHPPTAVAIVLDNSLSTTAVAGAAPLLEQLRAGALGVARGARTGDRLWLVTADGRVTGGSPDAVRSAIERTRPLAGAGDPVLAARRALGLVRGAGLAAWHVAVVTDGQASSWRDAVDADDVPVTVFAAAGAPPANHAVVHAEARPARWTPRGAVFGRVVAADTATYRITFAGRTLARGTVSPGGEVLVRASPGERGWTAGTIELPPDELRGDDVRHFAAWVGEAPAVQVDPALGEFVRTAADALIESGRLRRGADISLASAENVSRLPAMVVAPADPIRLGAANRSLERLGIPWRFGAPRRDAVSLRVAGDTASSASATVSLRYPLQPVGAGGGDTLARVGGEPWAMAGDRWIVVASPLDPAATSFPVQAAFVPWLGDVASQRLGGDAGAVLSVAPGDPLPTLPAAVTLERGDSAEAVSQGASVPAQPGVYFLRRGATRVGALVVNAEGEESMLERMTAGDLRARFTGTEARTVASADALASRAYGSAAGRPLVVPLLVLAALLLVAEGVLARQGSRAPAVLGRARAAA